MNKRKNGSKSASASSSSIAVLESWLGSGMNKKRSSLSAEVLHSKKPRQENDDDDDDDDEEEEESTVPAQQYRFLMNRCEVNLPVKPYPTQIAIMNAITKSVNKSENVLIESATGTGKSLALICASLAAARRLTINKLESAKSRPPPMPSESSSTSTDFSEPIEALRQIQPVQLTQQTQINQSIQATQQTQATQPYQLLQVKTGNDLSRQNPFTQPTQLTQSTQSTRPIQLTPNTQLTQQIQQIQATQQTQLTQQTQQTQATQPYQLVQVKTGNDLSQQNPFTQPTQYSQPTQATQPTQLTQSTQQTQPTQLTQATQPTQNTQPTKLIQNPIIVHQNLSTKNSSDAGGFIKDDGSTKLDQAQRQGPVTAQDKDIVRVFYGTRTHSQVKQIVKEVRRTMYKPLTVVLASRKHYCINENVRNSPDRDDMCIKMMLEKGIMRCPFANTEPLKKLVCNPCGSTMIPNTDIGHRDYRAYDVEDLVMEGRMLDSCPYLAANELAADAELVISPYNYIISESIRTSRHIVLNGDIVVIDEAHNISDALMGVASYDMTMKNLDTACIMLRTAAKTTGDKFSNEYRACLRYAARILNAYTDWMRSVESSLIRQDFEHYYRSWRGPEITEIYKSFGLPTKEHVSLFAYSVDCACGKATFAPEAVDKYREILKLSSLIDGNELDPPPPNESRGRYGQIAQALKENEVKYYRKESKITKPKYSNDPSSSSSSSMYGKNGYADKGKMSMYGDADESEKEPAVLEGPEMVCASMASSSADFILSHPEYVNDYRLIVDKTAVLVRNTSQRVSFVHKAAPSKEWFVAMGLWCMSPAVAFKGVSEPSQSVILASGTLAPFDPLVQELRAPFPTRVELSHVIDRCQVVACTAKRYEVSYSTTDNLEVQDYLGRSILECCRAIPSGVLCFFPSYALLSKLVKRWRETDLYDEISGAKGGNVFSELDVSKAFAERGGAGNGGSEYRDKGAPNDAEFAGFIKEFHKCARSPEGAILFAVCRGKSSEGVDFADESARGVIVVGIPYSSTHNVRVSLKREYEEAACKGAGSRWYVADGHRAVNQAIGRIIRNRWDYGAVVFLDSRYTRPTVKGELSKWIRNQIYEVDTVHDFVPSLRDFFENIPPYVQQKKDEFMAKMSSSSSSSSQQVKEAPK